MCIFVTWSLTGSSPLLEQTCEASKANYEAQIWYKEPEWCHHSDLCMDKSLVWQHEGHLCREILSDFWRINHERAYYKEKEPFSPLTELRSEVTDAAGFSTCIHLWKISLQYEVTCCTLTCLFKLNLLHNTKKPKKKKDIFPLLLWNSATMYIAFPLLTVRWCVLTCNAGVDLLEGDNVSELRHCGK